VKTTTFNDLWEVWKDQEATTLRNCARQARQDRARPIFDRKWTHEAKYEPYLVFLDALAARVRSRGSARIHELVDSEELRTELDGNAR
jgi:hypothetical protein